MKLAELPLDLDTLQLALTARITLAARKRADLPLEPLPWQPPKWGKLRHGDRIDVVRFAVNDCCSVQLIQRMSSRWSGRFAFHLILRARGEGFVDALIAVEDAPRTEFWDFDERFAETKFAAGKAGGQPAIALRRLIAGQGLVIAGCCSLADRGGAPPFAWHGFEANGGIMPADADDGILTQQMLMPGGWGQREQARILSLGRDVLHIPISGAAPNPGQTGGQVDFCFAVLAGHVLQMRNSVWQEFCRPSHWTELDGTPITQQQHPQLVLWNGTPHNQSRDKLGLPKDRWHGSNPGSAMSLKEPRETWASYDRQHWSINHLCAYAGQVDDPVAWELVRWQVEQWLFAHPVASGTFADSIDSPRAVGRGMAAAVKLAKLLERAVDRGDEGWDVRGRLLWDRILGRTQAVHAQLLRNLGVVGGLLAGSASMHLIHYGRRACDAGMDLGEVDPDLRGLKAIGVDDLKPWPLAELTAELGPVLEVRAPEGHGLPQHPHWRPWEEAIAAWGMALVADLTGDERARFVADLIALHVVTRGYSETDWQIAHAMVWPPRPSADLVHGDTVMWADGTDFRWWARPAVAYLRRRLIGLGAEHALARPVEDGGGPEVVLAVFSTGHQGFEFQLEAGLLQRCDAILATVPLPAEITLQNMWQAQWRSCWD